MTGQPDASLPRVRFACWKCCARRRPEEQAHRTAGGTLPGGRARASPVARRQPLLRAGCTNALFERLTEVPARWLKPAFVFLGSLPVPLNQPLVCPPSPQPVHGPAALPGPPPLAQGVVWGRGMVQSQISVTDKASVNSITNFRQQPCLLFFLKHRSSLLQVQERRNKPLRCGQWLWRSLFFLTLLLTFKYSGFIALKDALCKGIFQKAEGLTVLNMCSGTLGALLTKWASQRCSSTRNNRNVLAWWICGQARARTALRRLGNGRSGGMTSHVTADLRSSSFPSVFIVSERLWQTVLCQGACFLREGQIQWRKKSKKQLWTTPQPLHTKFSRLN